MLVKTVKATSKGQITIPAEVMKAIKARKGTEFLLVQDGGRIILEKAEAAGKRVVDDLEGFEALGLSVFHDLWDNEEDEVWNKYA